MSLRKLARGQECTVRIYGVCNHNPETTVLAHLRLANVAGIGQKPPDIIACFACSDCHDAIDGRRKTDLTKTQLEVHMLYALVRTLKIVGNYYKLTRK